MTKTLGIIGGLGPIATAYFMELIIRMTDAKCDQDHLDVLVYNRPKTPDRTKYILGLSDEDPTPVMIDTGRKLVEQGAECLAIPCITAHYFHERLEGAIGTPIIHLVREVALHLKENNIHKVGIMATDGTITTELFQTELKLQGMEAFIPCAENQKKVMHLIYDNVKASISPEMEFFNQVKEDLQGQGAEVIVLGCTELSLLKRDENIGPGFLDAMEVLSKKAIECCDAKIKEEFHCLIS